MFPLQITEEVTKLEGKINTLTDQNGEAQHLIEKYAEHFVFFIDCEDATAGFHTHMNYKKTPFFFLAFFQEHPFSCTYLLLFPKSPHHFISSHSFRTIHKFEQRAEEEAAAATAAAVKAQQEKEAAAATPQQRSIQQLPLGVTADAPEAIPIDLAALSRQKTGGGQTAPSATPYQTQNSNGSNTTLASPAAAASVPVAAPWWQKEDQPGGQVSEPLLGHNGGAQQQNGVRQLHPPNTANAYAPPGLSV